MLEVIEIIRDTSQGVTRPALCRADDENEYVIKGREAGNDGLIKEYICGALGQKFGLPIPPFSLINCSDELLNHDPELQRRFSGGPCFASKYQPHLQEFDRTSYVEDHAQLFRDIFVFDFWVKNDDRYFTAENGGNPNLLVDSGRKHISVIDHNLAFSADFDLQSFRMTHVGSKFWRAQQLDMLEMLDYQNKMSTIIGSLDNIIQELPDEWLMNEFGEVDFLSTLRHDLEQFSMTNFWSDLR
jgi:hypothetical protein